VRIVSPELGQLQLQLLQATVRATLARQAAQREHALFDEGIIAKRRVQEARAALQEAEATLNQAKAALRLSGMPSATIERIATSGKPQDSVTLLATQARDRHRYRGQTWPASRGSDGFVARGSNGLSVARYSASGVGNVWAGQPEPQVKSARPQPHGANLERKPDRLPRQSDSSTAGQPSKARPARFDPASW
jgi:hypothetical protein